MALFNHATKEVTAKLVYYGPALCGKTTNLQWIHDNVTFKVKGKLLSLSTEVDRTLFFDFLPVELGIIRGMRTRVQLYTVPGQVFYESTRRMVLKGADAVVFVCDSQAPLLEANLASLDSLRKNIEANELDPRIPMAVQYNKRDLANALPLAVLNAKLNPQGLSYFEAVATKGMGIEETLKGIIKLLFKSLADYYGGEAGRGARDAPPTPTPPRPVPEGPAARPPAPAASFRPPAAPAPAPTPRPPAPASAPGAPAPKVAAPAAPPSRPPAPAPPPAASRPPAPAAVTVTPTPAPAAPRPAPPPAAPPPAPTRAPTSSATPPKPAPAARPAQPAPGPAAAAPPAAPAKPPAADRGSSPPVPSGAPEEEPLTISGDLMAAEAPPREPREPREPEPKANGIGPNQWIYLTEGQQRGPLDLDDLIDLVLTSIPEDTKVWRKGLSGWTAATLVPEITEHIPPPLPTVGVTEEDFPDFNTVPEMLRVALIADEDPGFRKLLALPLAAQGFKIHEASDGAEAWKMATEHRPWLILADLGMPEIDGFEFCRRARANSLLRHTPLVFISGSDRYKDRYRAMQLGADDFLSKQTPIRELLIRVQLLMTRYSDLESGGRMEGVAGEPGRAGGLEGQIDVFGAPAVLQILNQGRVTGLFTARELAEGGDAAVFGFRDGEIISAVCQDKGGPEAVYAFLAWERGQFKFVPGDPGNGEPIARSVEHLLLEGCRLLDESRRGPEDSQPNL